MAGSDAITDTPPGEIGGANANSNLNPPVRLFVGLAVAPEIARELVKLAACLDAPFVRLVAAADLHVTLVPPWPEASVSGAIGKLCLAAGRFEAFWLAFQHIGYGPEPSRPRMLWADCAAGREIDIMRTSLLHAYGQTDERPFRPHVTLARIRDNGLQMARMRPIDQELSFMQRVETVELFQSPRPGEAGYRIVASARLGNTPHGIPPT